MKTTFSRMFALFAVVILLCLLLLGVAFRLTLSNYLEEEKRETLHNNAETLSYLASVYDAAGALDFRWGDFRITLASAAQIAGTDVMFCKIDGEIVLCSCDDVGCIHQGRSADPEREPRRQLH